MASAGLLFPLATVITLMGMGRTDRARDCCCALAATHRRCGDLQLGTCRQAAAAVRHAAAALQLQIGRSLINAVSVTTRKPAKQGRQSCWQAHLTEHWAMRSGMPPTASVVLLQRRRTRNRGGRKACGDKRSPNTRHVSGASYRLSFALPAGRAPIDVLESRLDTLGGRRGRSPPAQRPC